jgi:hypothetical protein
MRSVEMNKRERTIGKNECLYVKTTRAGTDRSEQGHATQVHGQVQAGLSHVNRVT